MSQESAQKFVPLCMHGNKRTRLCTPMLVAQLSEPLSLSRRKKGLVRDAALYGIEAASLCGSSWAFSTRSKAAAVWLALQWPVGVARKNREIPCASVSMYVFLCKSRAVLACIYVCHPGFEGVMELSCGLSGTSRAPPTLLCDREGEAPSLLSAFIPEWRRERLTQRRHQRACD